MIRAALAVALLAPALAACGTWSGPAVLLVRHAEKGPGRDPDLTGEGRRRALALVDIARERGVTAVIHTQFKRTAQTAEPLATHLGLPLLQVEYTPDQEDQFADDVFRTIQEKFPGQSVLVVGHTTTIPVFMRKLGVENPRKIPETEYGVVYAVSGSYVEEVHFGN